MNDGNRDIFEHAIRELTLDELDAVGGGGFWDVVLGVCDAVGGAVLKLIPALKL